MSEITLLYIFVAIGVFLCACSQLLLKQSANKTYSSWLSSMLNWRVILAYGIFFISLFVNITAMQHGLELKNIPIIESLGYVFVPLLSLLILKEKITIRTVFSMFFIILGIIIFNQ